jgi:hypothetical protein
VRESAKGSTSKDLRVLTEILGELRWTREANEEGRREILEEIRGLQEEFGALLRISHRIGMDVAELQGHGSGFVERYLGGEEENVATGTQTEDVDDKVEGQELEGNGAEEDIVDETLRE